MDASPFHKSIRTPVMPGGRKGELRHPEFWMTYWLAIALVIIKLIHFGLPTSTYPGKIWGYANDVLIATASDCLFAMILGAAAALSLLPWRRRQIALGIGRTIWIGFFALCVFYGVINSYVFEFTHTPITRGLLRYAGDCAELRSSLDYCIDSTAISFVIAAPLAYLLLVWASHRFIGFPRSRAARALVVLVAVGVVAQFLYAQSVRSHWNRRRDYRIADNAPWVLFSTFVLGKGDVEIKVPGGIPDSYFADFQLIGGRGSTTHAADHSRIRHVIVLVLESTSTQFLHVYGSPFPTTPNLDAEACHSVVFDNIYSHVGLTPRALVALVTSRYPCSLQWNDFDPTYSLQRPGVSIADVMKSRGARTLALSSADFSYGQQREFLKASGFDQIWDAKNLPGERLTSWGKADGPMIDKMLNWIDADPAHVQPFFALCWTNQTHHPYVLPPGEMEQDLLGKSAAPGPKDAGLVNRELNCLLDADKQIGRLLNGLRDRRMEDDTLVVITGDHGEAFNWPHKSRIHGFQLYEENLHVPCIFWNPRLFTRGRRVSTIGGHIDVIPTLADLLGIQSPGSWQGRSLFDPGRCGRAYFSAMAEDYLFGVRDGDWKYIYNATTETDELFNLGLDPQEQNDVAAMNGEICRELRRRLGAWTKYLDRRKQGV